jgi:hypothetical protein
MCRLLGIAGERGGDGGRGLRWRLCLGGCAEGFGGWVSFFGVIGFTDARHRRALTLRRPSGAWIWAKPAAALDDR